MKTSQLAQLTGLTVRRINQLIAESILPATNSGTFPDPDAALKAAFEHFKGQRQSGARSRYETALADLTELKLKREQKLVLPLADIERGMAGAIIQLREEILRLPRTIGSQTGNTAAQAIAEAACADALRECSKRLKKLADDEAARDDEETPAEK